MNRKKGPLIFPIGKLPMPHLQQYYLSNGIKVCEVNFGSQEIIKIEIVHKAGRSKEDYKLIGRATSSLLKEGCGTMTSSEIAEKIDYYGASIKTGSNMDFSYTSMYSLTKHIDHILPILSSMYTEPSFPEVEIQKFKHLNIQKLKEELTKNEVIAYRQITEEIFGKAHAYGYNSFEEEYHKIDKQKIVSHFNDYYGTDEAVIFLSGRITDDTRKCVSDYFGQIPKYSKQKLYQESLIPIAKKEIKITTKNDHQCAIKIGCKLFDKHHEDNAVFFVLNTILGGYFGSRLMTSIREDKGYTYDISSNMDQMLYDGCFYVSTEAAPQYADLILNETYFQMNLLQNEKINLTELDMVKNYLMGNFMNMLDGPMNVSSFAKALIMVGQNENDFELFIEQIKELSPEDIIKAAQKYLNQDQMVEIIVGP
ncbi:MAG: insulinase family protein [Saprospiraceae bacterium]|nr:insulinase family protein [Saprospiraceae bacterium]